MSTPVVGSIVPAVVVLVDHKPPGTEFVSVVVDPAHTVKEPPTAPGKVFTVTTVVAAQPVEGIV
jgi:hypothetical protein